MVNALNPEHFTGVWSAAPTPFDENMNLDFAAIERLTAHHFRLGIKGLFIAGTCGEGPWMPQAQKRELVKATVAAVGGKIPISVQVTDNSTARIVDNIGMAKEDGADVAVIAPPHFLRNATPANIQNLYLEAVTQSELPIIIYDLGNFSAIRIPSEVLETIYTAPNVVAIKDSSGEVERREIALAARAKCPHLRLLNGDEFNCVEYIQAGYDGLMLGGAAFQGYLAGQVIDAVHQGDIAGALKLQERLNNMMWDVYGGRTIECWLAGEKSLLQQLGIFSTTKNYLRYELTPTCEAAIENILAKDSDVLLPPVPVA
jgi:4-hydroxy-tetrahydrodipicolinate synthase